MSYTGFRQVVGAYWLQGMGAYTSSRMAVVVLLWAGEYGVQPVVGQLLMRPVRFVISMRAIRIWRTHLQLPRPLIDIVVALLG